MRLRILDEGHPFWARAVLGILRALWRRPVPDVIKLIHYRRAFWGKPMMRVAQEAMRGPSAWSVGDRELMAAFVSRVNQCEF